MAARGIQPTDAGIDFALLAATVTAADTRISRRTESQDSWTRELDLYVPVADPALWNAQAVLIARTLAFLTGDRWRLSFRPRHARYRKLLEAKAALLPAPFASVCLFSGGLDSFVGAIDLLEAKKKILFVSHYWDNSTSSQTQCATALGSVYGDLGPRHVRVRVGFENDLVKGSEPEKTTRGRSFLFLGLAAAAASGLKGEPTIYVPENGLISLNVPLDPLRLGAWSTRTTHPFYLARMQEILAGVGIPGTLDNPYRFRTKGEMMRGCSNAALLKKYAAITISCSSYTKGRFKGLKQGHCGYCVPCLIRRAAIVTAFAADTTRYSIPDLSAQTLDAGKAEAEDVRSFQLIGRRLAANDSLSRILVRKPGPLSDYAEKDIKEYAGVFKRGIAEVYDLIKAVKVRRL
ncbi:Qat anti-phage system QueC-like protein QatC [Sinorhizobium medicae]|uniref:Qat anti-phage system QueC-like protein QatC n=1 Tax=Sinorhizobium medicae TaxID=110321 RepID=UPI002B1BDADF|nr:Qat anti-phage system QueC-like protein QatC [Sinorhizobium medicae]WQO45912.1 Qat anti-phage system QueC-like protein QatC [Sinorhizobium medicae]